MVCKKWEIFNSEYLIRNQWLTVRQDHVKLPAGIEVEDYYVLEYPNWVTVIAITDEGCYVMVRQYRHGIKKTCYEICGGTVENNEDLLTAAQRELKEETGYEGGKWKLFTVTAPNPAAMTNVCYTYIAEGVFKTSEQSLERTEDIDVCEMTESELLNIMRNGQIIQGDMLAPLWQWMYNKIIQY